MEYGVQVDNKFAFGSDDELGDPSELLKLGVQEKKTPAQKKAEREEAKKAKAKEEANRKAAAAAAVPANKEVRPAASSERGGRGGQRGRGGPRPRGDGPRPPRPERPREEGETKDGFHEIHGRGRGRGAPRGDRPPYRGGRGGGQRPPATNEWPNADEAPKDVTDENTPPAFEGQRAFRGRGGFGGRGRGGFRPPRGAREFDRQSGSDRTGVRAQEKKEGHGKGNWGTEKDELAGETEEVKAEELENPPVPREKTAEELEQERIEAEIAAQRTLAEYKASLQKDEKKFNIRKANEGNQDSFGKLVPLAKKELHEDETHEVVIVQGKETKKKLVDLDIRFADAGRDQGHRGGSDRPRGRGRGGNRGGYGGAGRGGGGTGTGARPRHDPSYFKADLGNATEFPTLG